MKEKTCHQCRYFNSKREFLEKEFPGVLSLSSFLGSTTQGNGLCTKRDVFLPGRTRPCDCNRKSVQGLSGVFDIEKLEKNRDVQGK